MNFEFDLHFGLGIQPGVSLYQYYEIVTYDDCLV